MAKDKYLHRTKFLDLIDRDGWTFVRRPKLAGVVGIVAVTPAGELMLIEQHRPPLGKNVIELPAGLAGDLDAGESLAAAAKRELLEETGYRASRVKKLAEGTSSAGLTDEIITLFLATGLKRASDPPRDESENITLHLVPLQQVESFCAKAVRQGKQVDLKVYSALHFARSL